MEVVGDWDGKNRWLVASAGNTVMAYEIWPEERGDAPIGEHPTDRIFSFIGGSFQRFLDEVNRQRAVQGLPPYGPRPTTGAS